MKKETIIALLHRPDQPGLVAKASSWIFERGVILTMPINIKTQKPMYFFNELNGFSGDPEQEAEAFKAFAESSLKMNTKVLLNTKNKKLLSLSQN